MTDNSKDGAGLFNEMDREEKYLLAHFASDCGLMPGDIQGSFHRLREALTSPPQQGDDKPADGAREALESAERHLAFQHKWLSDQFDAMGRMREEGSASADTWDQIQATYEVWRSVKAALRAPAAHAQLGVHTARALDWQEILTDRGDGSSDVTGWEADSGFGPWYSVEQYFGSDSYGWLVDYDAVQIGDFDDPDRAKKCAQDDFAKRVAAALSPDTARGREDMLLVPRDTIHDALAGWHYIRKHHGDLYGVGWDRVEEKLSSALSSADREGK